LSYSPPGLPFTMSVEYDDWYDFEIDSREDERSLANFLQSKLTFSSSDEVLGEAPVPVVAAALPESVCSGEDVDVFDGFLGSSGGYVPIKAATDSVSVDSDSGWLSDPEHFQLQHPSCNNSEESEWWGREGTMELLPLQSLYKNFSESIAHTYFRKWQTKVCYVM